MNQSRKKRIARVLAVLIVAAMLLASLSGLMMPMLYGGAGIYVYAAEMKDGEAYLTEELEFFQLLLKDIQKNFKDEVTFGELMEGAYQGVFESLDDPYSEYYIDSAEGDQFVETVSGEFYGIGVSVENFEGKCRVVSPIAGTPADKAGILSGDIITHVGGTSLEGKNLNEAVSLMKGEAGTSVTITVERDGSIKNFDIVREKISNQSVYCKMLEDNIGYIQITNFDNDTHLEFKEARLTLLNQGAAGLVIDVRNNPGGLINSAVEIAEQLMPAGPIMHFQQQGNIIETVSASGMANTAIPNVLLINGGSASASEILAGALKDSGAATLVGTTTYGKGVAQQVFSLKNGASIKLSMYYFLTPNKTVIDKAGVEPHHVVNQARLENLDEAVAQYNGFAPVSEKAVYEAGQTGLNVYGAQQRLALIGYDVAVNGTMDARTVAAVKQFQNDQGLYAYGTLDQSTAKAIDTATISLLTGRDSDDVQLLKAIELLH